MSSTALNYIEQVFNKRGVHDTEKLDKIVDEKDVISVGMIFGNNQSHETICCTSINVTQKRQ